MDFVNLFGQFPRIIPKWTQSRFYLSQLRLHVVRREREGKQWIFLLTDVRSNEVKRAINTELI